MTFPIGAAAILWAFMLQGILEWYAKYAFIVNCVLVVIYLFLSAMMYRWIRPLRIVRCSGIVLIHVTYFGIIARTLFVSPPDEGAPIVAITVCILGTLITFATGIAGGLALEDRRI